MINCRGINIVNIEINEVWDNTDHPRIFLYYLTMDEEDLGIFFIKDDFGKPFHYKIQAPDLIIHFTLNIS